MSRPAGSRRSRRELLLRRVLPVALVVLLAGLVLVLTVGGDRDPGAVASPTTAGPTDEDEEPVDPEATPTPTEPASPATEALAAPAVAREGVPESARTVAASRAAFTAPAEWSDGASVRVLDAEQRVTKGNGPGTLAGQPQMVFTLEVTNGSDAALDLNSVVVQAIYGSAPTQASPLYDDETVDFAGMLEPGATAAAVYSFAVPAEETGNVTLSVDVDGYRFPAVFTGAVPVR